MIGAAAIALLLSCSKETAPSVRLSVQADKTVVNAGEPVTFTIEHNAMALCIYTGDDGHDYTLSSGYILDGKSEDEIQGENFRPIDEDVVPFECDLKDSEAGASEVTDNLIQVLNAGGGWNLIGSEAEIEYDNTISQNVLRINSVHPEWWYQAIRLNTNTKLGSDKTMTIRMRFASDVLKDAGSGDDRPDISTFMVVIRIAGIAEGESEVIFRDETVWDIYWQPETSYTDYSVDMSRIIEAWEGATGKTMETLSYIQMLFTPSNNAGYYGDFYVSGATYGGIDYISFATGEDIAINDDSGTVQYQYTYTTPGTYHVVVIGSSNSLKNYSGSGYKDERGSNVNRDEFNYGTTKATLDITVN